MKKYMYVIILAVVLASPTVFADDSTSAMLKAAGDLGQQSLVVVQCETEDELGRRTVLGTGI